MNPEEFLADAPDGTNCVTIVANSTSGTPAAIISQFTEDKDGNWTANGTPLSLPVAQLPDLIDMLGNVLATSDPA